MFDDPLAKVLLVIRENSKIAETYYQGLIDLRFPDQNIYLTLTTVLQRQVDCHQQILTYRTRQTQVTLNVPTLVGMVTSVASLS